jgi:hypothetical protein
MRIGSIYSRRLFAAEPSPEPAMAAAMSLHAARTTPSLSGLVDRDAIQALNLCFNCLFRFLPEVAKR